MLKVTKAWETIKNYNKKYLKLKIYLKAKLKKWVLTAVLKVSNVFILRIAEGNAFQR